MGSTQPDRTIRVAVIGDVGGHLDELRRELERLGADPDTGTLPADLTVIQVGDLIHRGPDSDGVIAFVDRMLDEQPDQWIQLVGNHEANYLADPAFDWPEHLCAQSVQTLRRWWGDGRLLVAAAVRGRGQQDFLITHAGVTRTYWRSVLGAPHSAAGAAAALNAMIGHHDGLLFRSGQMLGSGPPRPGAGPLWAAAGTELLPSWLTWRPPFNQVHGHSTLYSWQHGHFGTRREVRLRTRVDTRARHEVTMFAGGRRIVGVDPCHGVTAAPSWRSWEVPIKPVPVTPE